MAEIYRLPAVSPTMETGLLVAWKLDVGDAFEAGTVVAEVGTDKATMEAEIFEDGVLLARLVEEDDEVPVDAPIAVWGEEGEDAAELIEAARQELEKMRSAGGGSPASGDTDAEPETPPAQTTPTTPEAQSPSPSSEPPPQADLTRTWQGQALPPLFLEPPGDLGLFGRSSSSDAKAPAKVKASPAARRAAQVAGVAISSVEGTGPHGRVLTRDVDQAPRSPSSGPSASHQVADTSRKLSPMRRTIARRLTEVHQTIPSFTLQVTFDMSGFVRLRERLKRSFPDDRISYNDLLVAAVGRALRAYPQANTRWSDTHLITHGDVHVGIAVAVDEGLITPVIRHCDTRSIREIAQASRELASKAREGKLVPEEYQGNTFTVSNLGMMGIRNFTAIINPPASAILAVGALEERPVVDHGQLTTGWRMDLTLTCDHRVIDGAVGAGFLQVLRTFVEEPATMLA